MKLATTYLGMKLRTPLVPSASPLSEKLDNIKRMEDAGASAVVFHSLFEEQLRPVNHPMRLASRNGGDFSYNAFENCSDEPEFNVDPEAYVRHIAKAKEAVSIPIIGSLNGSTFGGWQRYARLIEKAGADALELNLYNVPTDPQRAADDIEIEYLTIVASIKSLLKIPVAVKLSPYFTNLSQFARRLDEQGANALVLFNRFYQPDIELETLEVNPNILLSTPMAMRLPMRWIAILYGRIGANLAATSGIYHGVDALKMIMAGADITMLCSVLLRYGIDHIRVLEREMSEWMEDHEYKSIEQIKGIMSQKNCADPGAFERAQYTCALKSYPRSQSSTAAA
jgi:dihydroorotate dehydrogenase (fumarate)